MDKTKTKLAAFFDNDEESSFPQKTVDAAKISQYSSATVRKSKRERDLEAAEAKKREEEEYAAKAYADFLDDFDGEGAGKRKTGSNFVKAESKTVYAPSVKNVPEGPSRSHFNKDLSPSPPASNAAKPKGKRAMDSFLEEIKREQAEREARYSRHAHGQGRSVTALAAYEGQSGSKDRGDPQTSNVFVANLPAHVTEQSLGQFFARLGPVGSVKIMWPRSDGTAGPGADMTSSRRSKSTALSGFVSFMKRKDAEAALREFDGFDWGGSILRVGWSKAVPVAAKAMYISAPTINEKSPSRSRSRSRSRDHRARSPAQGKHYSRHSRSPSRSRSRSRSPRRGGYGHSRRRDDSRSRSPRRRRSPSPPNEEELVTDGFIRAVAAEVKGHGLKYEESLRERERSNPKFSFLLRKNHRRHAFYRGLVESERAIKPEFQDDGEHSVYSTDSAEDSERERTRKNALGRLARKRFESMLRALSGKRGEMARCMAFSLEHAEAAHEVADIIVTSLLVDDTPVPRKVARLHLICDILHNSAASVPSAWKFRQEFQPRLGIVFDHLSNIYHSFPGRITAETFKKQITAVVDVWEDWIVFPPDFTAALRLRLEGATAEAQQEEPEKTVEITEETPETFTSRFKPSTFQLATDAPTVPLGNPEDGEAMDVGSDIDGEPAVDDVDGEPVDDVDGEPMNDEDLDGAPIDDEDLDGAPMDDVAVDDVDGEPMNDDVDGEPLRDKVPIIV